MNELKLGSFSHAAIELGLLLLALELTFHDAQAQVRLLFLLEDVVWIFFLRSFVLVISVESIDFEVGPVFGELLVARHFPEINMIVLEPLQCMRPLNQKVYDSCRYLVTIQMDGTKGLRASESWPNMPELLLIESSVGQIDMLQVLISLQKVAEVLHAFLIFFSLQLASQRLAHRSFF